MRPSDDLILQGFRGYCAQRRRTGADTHCAQLWTSRTATAAPSVGPKMGSFKYKWEDLQKLVLLTFNNTTAAVLPPVPPVPRHSSLS